MPGGQGKNCQGKRVFWPISPENLRHTSDREDFHPVGSRLAERRRKTPPSVCLLSPARGLQAAESFAATSRSGFNRVSGVTWSA